MVTQRFLLEGAVYALQHSGTLLRDAVALFNQGSYPSAIVLALFGREELGKYGLLRDSFEKLAAGEAVDMKAVRAACRDHEAKQARAMLSVTQRFFVTDQAGKAIMDRMHHPVGSPEYEEAERLLDELTARQMATMPCDRHQIRMSALYVNPKADGSGWERPQDQTVGDIRYEVNDAVNDYRNVYDRLVLGHDRPSKFLTEFQAWTNRPEIPEPVSPQS
jgi:AbiV family abortive infection protein